MGTINERIRKVVELSGLSKTTFAQKINVSQQYISKLVNNGTPSDRTISDICREFGVDEVWLRTGVGEPFRQESREEQIMRFAAQTIKGSDEFRKAFVSTLAKMDADDWITLGKLFDNLANEMKKTDP